jgi:hypothetical protein
MKNSNEKQSIFVNQAAYNELQQYFAPSRRSSAQVQSTRPVPLSDQIRHSLELQPTGNDEVDGWHVQRLLDHHRVEQSAIQYHYGDGKHILTTASKSVAKGMKRALPSDADPSPVVSKRKARTCVRCRHDDCNGRWQSSRCTNSPAVRT